MDLEPANSPGRPPRPGPLSYTYADSSYIVYLFLIKAVVTGAERQGTHMPFGGRHSTHDAVFASVTVKAFGLQAPVGGTELQRGRRGKWCPGGPGGLDGVIWGTKWPSGGCGSQSWPGGHGRIGTRAESLPPDRR